MVAPWVVTTYRLINTTTIRAKAITAIPMKTKISGDTFPPPPACGIAPAVGSCIPGAVGNEGGLGADGMAGAEGMEGMPGADGTLGMGGADGMEGVGGNPIPPWSTGGGAFAGGAPCDLIMRVYSLGPSGSTTCFGGGPPTTGLSKSPVAPVEG